MKNDREFCENALISFIVGKENIYLYWRDL